MLLGFAEEAGREEGAAHGDFVEVEVAGAEGGGGEGERGEEGEEGEVEDGGEHF